MLALWSEAQGAGLDQPGEGKTLGNLTASPVPERRWSQALHKDSQLEVER